MMKPITNRPSNSIIALLFFASVAAIAQALAPIGQSTCISSHYTRPTTFEGGPYDVTMYYWCGTLHPNAKDITLVTQFTLDRAEKFQRLAAAWEGPIVATLVLNYGETLDHLSEFWSTAYWPIMFYTDIHIVWGNEKGNYPVNLARNVAIETVKTERVFLVDVDFFTHQEIRKLINNGTIDEELAMLDNKTVIVFPAFEYPDKKKYKRVYIPPSKDEMYQLVKSGDLEIFHQHTCPGCHRPSNYSAWFHPNTSTSYEIEYQKHASRSPLLMLYEPYVIANVADLPAFDERFADYGRNKIQFFFDLNLRGFKFRVLPFPFFVIHENHDDSKWRVDFIDPATRAKEKSSELWSNYQQRRKTFFELSDEVKIDIVNEDMTFRKVVGLSSHAYTAAGGRAAADDSRLRKLLKDQQKMLRQYFTTCGPSSPDANIQTSYMSYLITGAMSASPALFGLALLYKRNVVKRRKTLAFISCGVSIFYLAIFQLQPSIVLTTKAAAVQSFPEFNFPDAAFLALSAPADLVKFICLVRKGHPEAVSAFENVLYHANVKYLSMPSRTVMNKGGIAPSGSKHDFFSRTFYIPGRDGEMHPDVFSSQFDKTALWDLESQCLHLGLAYLVTGEEKYAKKLATAIYDWFLNPLTYMTPHFLFASTDVDSNSSVGRQYGLVEAHPVKIIIEMASVISNTESWSSQNTDFLRTWIRKLALWYQTSEFGHLEEKSGNNHQTGFYVMLSWMLTIQGDVAVARRLIDHAKYKLFAADAFSKDGSQPRELKRPDAWWYVGYNLLFMTEIAAIAEEVEVDFWHFEHHGRGIIRALEWLLSHLMECEKFKYGTHPLSQADLTLTVFPAFRRAAIHLDDPRYEVAITQLSQKFGIHASDMIPSFSTLLPPPTFTTSQLNGAAAALSCEHILESRASKMSKGNSKDDQKAAALSGLTDIGLA